MKMEDRGKLKKRRREEEEEKKEKGRGEVGEEGKSR
jgi:hypothetical protein